MPNWTYNTVEMNGIAKEDLFETIDRNEKTYTYFDFNKLIPEPKSKEECLEKYGERYIDNGNCSLMHDEGNEWFNWYDWRCDFWGTKWGACDTYIVDDKTIQFKTACSEPEPIWIALSKRYPNKEIKIAASYEDSWETRSTYLNGERIEYSEWEREYEDDDYEEDEEEAKTVMKERIDQWVIDDAWNEYDSEDQFDIFIDYEEVNEDDE